MALNFVAPPGQFMLIQEIFEHPDPARLEDHSILTHGVLAEVDLAAETATIRHRGHSLRVLTNLLQPFRFRLLSKYRFVGELRRVATPGRHRWVPAAAEDSPEALSKAGRAPGDEAIQIHGSVRWILQARVYQCIDGLEEELWLQGLRLQRRMLQLIHVPILGDPGIGLLLPSPEMAQPFPEDGLPGQAAVQYHPTGSGGGGRAGGQAQRDARVLRSPPPGASRMLAQPAAPQPPAERQLSAGSWDPQPPPAPGDHVFDLDAELAAEDELRSMHFDPCVAEEPHGGQ